jgi:hypothetical protein
MIDRGEPPSSIFYLLSSIFWLLASGFWLLSSELQPPRLGKGLEAAIIGLLCSGREATAGQLSGGQVIGQTFTAHALSAASLVGATAVLEVLLFLALHGRLLTFLHPVYLF